MRIAITNKDDGNYCNMCVHECLVSLTYYAILLRCFSCLTCLIFFNSRQRDAMEDQELVGYLKHPKRLAVYYTSKRTTQKHTLTCSLPIQTTGRTDRRLLLALHLPELRQVGGRCR